MKRLLITFALLAAIVGGTLWAQQTPTNQTAKPKSGTTVTLYSGGQAVKTWTNVRLSNTEGPNVIFFDENGDYFHVRGTVVVERPKSALP